MEKTNKISFIANGRAHEVEPGTTIRGFLETIGVPPGQVVVERNGEALTGNEAAATTIDPGDSLEVVRIVAGG